MSQAESTAEKQIKSGVLAITIIAVALGVMVALWFAFRYYPEKKVVSQFFVALTSGDIPKSYSLWKPSSSYTMNSFLADWGPSGAYGPIKSYKIMGASAVRNSASVAVSVAISPYAPMPQPDDSEKSMKTKVVTIWVLPADKSFSFPVPN
jgi:hypothetical protein